MSNNRTPYTLAFGKDGAYVGVKVEGRKQRNVTIIAALDENAAIGKDNTIPWHVPEDYQHFKRMTSGHPVIMGRKTYESLPKGEDGFPTLDDRQIIVITGNNAWRSDYKIASEVLVVRSLEKALEAAGERQVFIIGGQSIFEEGLKYADDMLLTVIGTQIQGADRHFPFLAAADLFEVTLSQVVQNVSKKNGTTYKFHIWQRKQKVKDVGLDKFMAGLKTAAGTAYQAGRSAGYLKGRREGFEEGLQLSREITHEHANDPSTEVGKKIQVRIMKMTSPEIRKEITGDADTCPTIEQLEAWAAKNNPSGT